jgi:hypothetical protein
MFNANHPPILRQNLHSLKIDRSEHPLEAHHLGVLSGAPKLFYEPMYVWRKPCTYLAPTLTLSPNGPKLDST